MLALWTAVLFLCIFTPRLASSAGPVGLEIFPEVPRGDEPLMVTLQLKNPRPSEALYEYELFKDGELFTFGKAYLKPHSSKSIPNAYFSDLGVGERVVFLGKVRTPEGEYREEVSLPAYPPQVWSSFVSFATFSTSMAGITSTSSVASSSLTTITAMTYYRDHFSPADDLNVGVIFSLALIAMLGYVEVAGTFRNTPSPLSRLKRRFSRLAAILLFVFTTMVFTQTVFIIG